MKKLVADAVPENGHVVPEEAEADEALAPISADLKERLAGVEAQITQHNHNIAPEFIESIIQQAKKQAVQQVVTQLRKALDVLEALEK